jgi:hypothetical protein
VSLKILAQVEMTFLISSQGMILVKIGWAEGNPVYISNQNITYIYGWLFN